MTTFLTIYFLLSLAFVVVFCRMVANEESKDDKAYRDWLLNDLANGNK